MVHSEKSTTVATVNQQKIVVVEKEGLELVPVRPICEALGIDFSSQLQRLKRDQILNSTMVTVTTVGGDEKQREMAALPLKFIFGWLFTIDVNQVRPEAREAVIQFQMECYNALYDYFISYREFEEERRRKVVDANERARAARRDFNAAKSRIKEAEEELDGALALTIDDWRNNKAQLSLSFAEDFMNTNLSEE